MIEAKSISFGYVGESLYERVSFTVGKNQKVGLVGPNGSGKSTLLKIIRGLEEVTAGSITVVGSIGYVPQEIKQDPILDRATTILEYVDPTNSNEEHIVLKIFSGLELSIPLDQHPRSLSGGQKTKLALARALIANPDILLLDEPTNFMDIEGTKWVMDFLSSYEGTVICISHDLKLMDTAITKVLAVEPQYHRIDEYKGNYSDYIRLKAEKEKLLEKQIRVQQKKIKTMKEGLKKMKRLSSEKGVRARIRQQKRIEQLEQNLPDAPKEISVMKVSLPDPAKIGELPLRAKGISKSYGEKQILQSVDLVIRRGERTALIGPNGVGKSTFIKILMNMIDSDAGSIHEDPALSIGYYSQEFENFDLEKRVIDVFMDEIKSTEQFARDFLGRFLLKDEKIYQRVETLSGGEKTRLAIAILTGAHHNLLILDEPTTYLDPMSQRIILESLKEYKGSMLVVSHTPAFIKELEPDYAFLLPEEKVSYWRDEFVDRVSEF